MRFVSWCRLLWWSVEPVAFFLGFRIQTRAAASRRHSHSTLLHQHTHTPLTHSYRSTFNAQDNRRAPSYRFAVVVFVHSKHRSCVVYRSDFANCTQEPIQWQWKIPNCYEYVYLAIRPSTVSLRFVRSFVRWLRSRARCTYTKRTYGIQTNKWMINEWMTIVCIFWFGDVLTKPPPVDR